MTDISTTIPEPTIRRALNRDEDALSEVVPRLPTIDLARRFITDDKGRSGALDLPPALDRPAHAQRMRYAPEGR
jgi:hypothetical protein